MHAKYLSCLKRQLDSNNCEHAQYKDLKKGVYHSEKSGSGLRMCGVMTKASNTHVTKVWMAKHFRYNDA